MTDRLSSDAEGGCLSYYEQFNTAPICRDTSAPWIVGWNDGKRQAIVWKPPCNRWTCEACGPVNRAKAAIRCYVGVEEMIAAGRMPYFLTLTSHEKLNAWSSWKVFPKAWNKLRTRASRSDAGGWYFMVREGHDDGRCHAHAVTSWAMDDGWWHDNARQSGLGFMAENRPAKTAAGGGAYVLKYLVKQMQAAIWTKGSRRYNASQAWPDLPELESGKEWQFARVPIGQSVQYTMREWHESGFDVRLLEKGQRVREWDSIFGKINLEAQNDDKADAHERRS